jgi:hypothetical protein
MDHGTTIMKATEITMMKATETTRKRTEATMKVLGTMDNHMK